MKPKKIRSPLTSRSTPAPAALPARLPLPKKAFKVGYISGNGMIIEMYSVDGLIITPAGALILFDYMEGVDFNLGLYNTRAAFGIGVWQWIVQVDSTGKPLSLIEVPQQKLDA